MSPCAVKEPAELANVNVWPAGSVVPAGTVARALAVPALLEPHTVQPPMSIAAPVTLRISTTSSLPPAGPPNADCEMTTPVAARAVEAAEAPRINTTAATAVEKRNFTVLESFPRGNPGSVGGQPSVAARGCVTVR